MTVAGKIDIRSSKPVKEGDLLLGEDWESPEAGVDPTISEGRARRGLISLNRSPLARKIIVFNLLALTVLVAGVLFLNPFRDSLVVQRERALVTEAQLVANVVSRFKRLRATCRAVWVGFLLVRVLRCSCLTQVAHWWPRRLAKSALASRRTNRARPSSLTFSTQSGAGYPLSSAATKARTSLTRAHRLRVVCLCRRFPVTPLR